MNLILFRAVRGAKLCEAFWARNSARLLGAKLFEAFLGRHFGAKSLGAGFIFNFLWKKRLKYSMISLAKQGAAA